MIRADIVAAAQRWLGTPYHHQGSRLGVGCDCFGLVRGLWRELVGPEPEDVPAYTPDWAEARGEEAMLGAASRHFVGPAPLRPGAIVLFRWRAGMPAKHAGVMLSAETFAHAYDGAGKVVAGAMVPFWRRRIAGAFDFPGVSD